VRVAVLGAGVTGLVTAYRLGRRGHACDIYERWPGLGGQAATLPVGDGVLLERYYHHLFTSDRHIADLYDELDMPDELEWRRSNVATFTDNRSWPFNSPLDILRFKPLKLRSRLRMGLAVLQLQRKHGEDYTPFEHETARDWIEREMGAEAYARVWGPLLRAKFGDRADDIAMPWLWSKFTLRRKVQGKEAREERLGYPRGSFETLYAALRERIEAAGGRVLIDRPAASLDHDGEGFDIVPGAPDSYRAGHDPRAFAKLGAPERYEAVVATVPSDVFLALLTPRLAERIGEPYLERVGSIEYFTALCLLLELDRQFSPFYWTTIADPGLPFVGLIEQTNFVEPERYGGRRFLYVANYRTAGDPLLELDPDALIERYLRGLRRVNPDFSPEWIKQRWLFREPAAQPIVTVGYGDRMPALNTGVPGLVLANTTQIYPEDRGTNYSVRLADEAVAALLGDAGATARPRGAGAAAA
jgi:protoporphyrinogen oxidase